MTALTIKERTSINAALATVHASGHDVAPLQQQAKAAGGTYAAYKRVMGEFVNANPDLAPVLVHTDRLVEASDAQTVARYDKALSAYIRTGDESHVNALEGMVRADSVALAVRGGALSTEDAAAGRVDWGGMGLAAPAAAPAAPAKFSFADASPATPASSPGQPSITRSAPASSSVTRPASNTATPAGTVGRSYGFANVSAAGGGIAERRERFNALPTPGSSRPTPYAGMAPDQIKEAMRADFAARTGWQREPEAG